ncbi:hypothetical protein Hanom_Chr03g00241401 [Helianthus anomalus]
MKNINTCSLAKPNKKWTRGHGMRPSSTGCVLQVFEVSGEISGELQISDEFSCELLDTSPRLASSK